MKVLPQFFACLAILGAPLHAAVVLIANTAAPATDVLDQFNFLDDATIPGGTFNQQAFSDNAGPPGQTFTTPIGAGFLLQSFAFKGANTGTGNVGGNVQTGTWAIRVSSVLGTTLTPLLSLTNIPSPNPLVGTEWMTWSFSGADVLTLSGGTTYAVEVYSSSGYYGFDAAVDPNAYAGGVAFNSTAAARTFNSTTLQDRGYDRTFHADLALVPEPSLSFLMAAGLCPLGLHRRRRKGQGRIVGGAWRLGAAWRAVATT